MSHSRKRAGGRSFSQQDRGRWRPHAQPFKPHREQSKGTVFSTLIGLGIALVLLLGLALMVFIVHESSIASASGGGPTVSPGYGSLNHSKGTCGNAGQAACPAVDPGWFPVNSESPGAVAAAIAGSRNVAAIAPQYGCASFDTPALVHAYGAHTGMDYYDDDHWVVSMRDSTGMRCGIFDFVYDRARQRMRFSSFGVLTAQDPHARQAFPYVSSSVAIAQLQDQRKLSLLAGTLPQLIFFPIDPNFPVLTSPVHKWAGGGNSAMNPMWYLVGLDGQGYFVGADLNVYTQRDLPIAKGQP
jgi:hypothetical protein